ncbi:hypothetical protein M9H77_08472 [Catharanthus roseus]|uniref:Uncharacterized protein n=1 Tax=Catharanthus roseus TaxID=4058 RepID=A0ACC0BY28_CATRO|nr:hypothetical protein M9H77_08472 [Catharanthus roseus]
MEEVPTHVHPGPIVPDIFSRQQEHCEKGTLGSMDPESFVWFPYLDRGMVPSDLWWAEYIPDACDTRLDLHWIHLRRNDHTYWETHHASHIEAWYQWRLRVRDGPDLDVETSMSQEVDDMASLVIQEPPSSSL